MTFRDHAMAPDPLASCPLEGKDWSDIREIEARSGLLAEALPGFAYGGAQFSMLSCRAELTPPDIVINPHRHNHLEIILILAGEARETTEKGQMLRAGTLQVHALGELHGWRGIGQAVLRLGLCFTVQPAVAFIRPEFWPQDPAWVELARELLAETVSSSPGRRERLHARLVLLLAPAFALLDLPEQPSLPILNERVRNFDMTGLVDRF
ncbi:MAG: hypothetical protein HQL31_03135, partial [Planctomycetes bacterium]|nr:hypothetical protein [Planctomycetota bacterium]